ncbi:MAG TPA: hypothetical protein VF041_03455 [Gemmatimonadaceae bacterium]
MFSTIRRYTVASGIARQIAPRVEAELLPRLRAIPGFVSYELIVGGPDEGRDALASVSTYTTRDGVDESGRVAARWVADSLKGIDIQPTGTTTGEVLLSTQMAGSAA